MLNSQRLVDAVATLGAEDAFKPRLTLDQWRILEGYLQASDLRAGDLVVRQGDTDRTVYLIESGSMQVFRAADPNAAGGALRTRIAILQPGAVFGEGGLFGPQTRLAHVEAMTASRVWGLRSARFDELALRQPGIAIEILRAAGATYATRMRMNLASQVAFT